MCKCFKLLQIWIDQGRVQDLQIQTEFEEVKILLKYHLLMRVYCAAPWANSVGMAPKWYQWLMMHGSWTEDPSLQTAFQNWLFANK